MKNELELLTEKYVKARTEVSKVLVKTLDLDKDIADVIAMQMVKEGVGEDKLKELKRKKFLEHIKPYVIKSVVGVFGSLLALSIIWFALLPFLAYIGRGIIYTFSFYPRAYTAIAETERFADEVYEYKRGGDRWKRNKLCIRGYGTEKGEGTSCIHRNKVNQLNQALDEAVKQDKDGVVWEAPNGNGEIWKVERNNYRFIITASWDEGYK